MTNRRNFVAAALAALGPLAATRSAWAADAFPQRPIKLIVPNPPGGSSDIVARFLAESMRAELGQPLVIDNRPGASGLIGTAVVANAPPDGYTVLVTSRSNHIVAPLVQQGAQVDPVRDLAPVGLALRAVGILATPAKSPWRAARVHRTGQGAAGQAVLRQRRHRRDQPHRHRAVQGAGRHLVHVPYKGSGPLITGLMGGEVQLALLDFSSAQAGLKGGTLVPLAQTGSRRLSSMAEVPTLAESGFPRFDPSFWIGLAVPRPTPAPVIARLNKALDMALADTQMKARAQVNGWELIGGAPTALEATIRQDMADFPPLVRRLDLKA